MSIDSDRRRQDIGNVPNRRKEERRKTKNTFHLFRRNADPSLWIPGVITVIVAAAIVWAASELNTIDGLEKFNERTLAWQTEHELRVRNLELIIMQVAQRNGVKGIYMATSYGEDE